MGYILFLIFVALLVAIDLIVGTCVRKPRAARAAARAFAGEDKTR